MTDERPTYWFHAKRFGWGWGLPATWQGWLVIVGYAALLVGGRLIMAAPTVFVPYVVAMTAVLIGVVIATGEKPPRWRWGKD